MSSRPSFEATVDTRLLAQTLKQAAVGETVTFETLSNAIGRPVTGGDPHMQSARRMAERDNGAVFASVHGTGYKRLVDEDIVKASESGLRRIKRAARREGNKLAVVDPMRLTNTDRDLFFARMSSFSIVSHVTKEQSINKLIGATREKGQELAIAQTLKALSDGLL